MGKRKRELQASPSRSASSLQRGGGESRSVRTGDVDDSSSADSEAWAAFDAEVQAELAAQAAADAACSLSPQARAHQTCRDRSHTWLTRFAAAQGAATPATRAAPRSLDAAVVVVARPSQSGSALASLPPELLRRVLRWLSSEDLSCAGATCVALRRAASEAEPWRRLYRLRWPAAPGEPDPPNWRAALRERDAEELRAVEAGPLAEIYRQQLIARRAQAPTAAALAADEATSAAAAGTVPAALAAWRRRNWASAVITTADGTGGAAVGGAQHDAAAAASHRCTAACAFAPLPLPAGVPPVWVCAASGRAHSCDDACREERRGGGGEVTLLCGVTGAVLGQYYDDAEEDDARRGGDAAAAAADEDAAAFLPGSFGRAYCIGYECASEAELRAAMWGGGGSSRGSSAPRRRFATEE